MVARAVLLIALIGTVAANAVAQDLEPRAYSAAPIDMNFFVAAFGRSSGDVLIDPSLQVSNVKATVHSTAVGVGRTFDLLGRTALVVAVVPYAWASATGDVAETARSISRSGLADPRIKLSVNLIGGRALTRQEFAKVKRPTIVGASLTVVPPLGQYDSQKLVNLGANRWAFRPETGISHQTGRWTLDGYAAVWLFTSNDAFYTGTSVRTQRPIFAVQTHASYTLKPRLWIAADTTCISGGTTEVNGVRKADFQRNTRVGLTVSVPLSPRQSLKIGYSGGTTTRIGADFRTLAVAWQISWFGP